MNSTEPLLSPQWYRIAFLRPRLRDGVTVVPHLVRGEQWYVLSDSVTGRHHRFNEKAYRLIAACDGRSTIDDIWALCTERDGDELASQGEAIDIFAQAFSASLFVGSPDPDVATVMKVDDSRKRKRWFASLNPLAFRMPLWDPNTFLDKSFPWVAWLFSVPARFALYAVIAIGVVLFSFNALDIGEYARVNMQSGSMLLMIWLTFPFIKAAHELAHAYTLKALGGQVHEIGVTLLMLTPMPYVDASASNAMSDKWDRIGVAAAGILCEAFIASVGLIFWLLLEPGLARDLAFATVFAGLISTLLVNANPLLKFDGYFVFCDFLELPNLGVRSNRFWQWLMRARLLRLTDIRFGSELPGERKWLLLYAPLSWLYRLFLITGIAMLLAQWSPGLGLVLLCLGLWMSVGKPLWKTLSWLVKSPELQLRRTQVQLVVLAAVALVSMALVWVPVPQKTYAAGLVWLPQNALVRTETEGVLTRFLVSDGQFVSKGDPIAVLTNDRQKAALASAKIAVASSRIEQVKLFGDNAGKALSARETAQSLERVYEEEHRKLLALTVRAQASGVVRISPGNPAIGQFAQRGQIVAYVMDGQGPTVRALVRNEDIDLVRRHPGSIEVEFQTAGIRARAAELSGVISGASRILPGDALSIAAGGSIELVADDQGRTAARTPRFAIDLVVPEAHELPVGARVLATFNHGSTTTAGLLARIVKQSFLRHFHV